MSVVPGFYLAQANACEAAAKACGLTNQREMYIRSRDAWQALADREAMVAEARRRREAEQDRAGTEPAAAE
jgi:hypothetical protein